jgi:hypothetical protein
MPSADPVNAIEKLESIISTISNAGIAGFVCTQPDDNIVSVVLTTIIVSFLGSMKYSRWGERSLRVLLRVKFDPIADGIEHCKVTNCSRAQVVGEEDVTTILGYDWSPRCNTVKPIRDPEHFSKQGNCKQSRSCSRNRERQSNKTV